MQISEQQNAPKLTNWKNEPDIISLKEDFKGAEQEQSKMLSKIKDWRDLKNVEGVYKPKKVKGRSSIQPKLIRKQAEWRYPTLSEPFLDVQDVYHIKPRTWEDPKAARQNNLLLNYQFNHELDKVNFIDEYVRRNVDEGLCIVKTFWNRETENVKKIISVYQYQQIVDETEIERFVTLAQIKETNPNGFLSLPLEMQASINYFFENNVPVIATEIGKEEVIEEKIIIDQPDLEIIKPDNFYVDPTCGSNYQNANFVVFSYESSKAELLKSGKFKNLEYVNFDADTINSDTDHTAETPQTFNFSDTARKRIVVYEYWGKRDINGDGKLVPIVCSWVNGTIIQMQESPFPQGKLPFVISKYNPILGSIYGESDAELLRDNQITLGALSRANIDLVGKSAQSQTGYANGFLDTVNKERFLAGENFMYNPNIDPSRGIYQLKSPEVTQSSILMMNQQQQEAESITGTKFFPEGINGKQFGTLNAQIKGTLAATDERKSASLRRLIDGIIKIGKNIVMLNSKFLADEKVIRVTNENFERIRKEDLGGAFDFETHIFLPEVNAKKVNDLIVLFQTVLPAMGEQAFPLVQKAIAEMVHLMNMPQLEHEIRNFNPQPTPEQQQLAQLEIQKATLELEKLQSEIDVNKAKVQDLMAGANSTNFETEEKLSGEAERKEIQRQQAQAKGNEELEITKSIMNKDVPDTNIEAAIGYKQIRNNLENNI